MSTARVGAISFWHETNGYSKRRAGLAQWEDYELLAGAEFFSAHTGTRSVVGGFIDELGEAIVPIFSAGAWPSGPAPANVVAQLLERLTSELKEAGSLDAIVLNLHGAMVADGIDDVEVALIRQIRGVCGDIPISAVVDFHGNPSVDLVAGVDALIAYQTYPHIDMWECGSEAAKLAKRMLAGERVATSLAKLPYLTSPLVQGTVDGPIGDVLSWMIDEAPGRGVLRCSVMAGFAYQDVERAGMTVLSVATVDNQASSEQLVNETIDRLMAAHDRGEFTAVLPSAGEAVKQAVAAQATPVVLVDIADNIGAGSAGDGTVILDQLLAQEATGAVVVIADADAVRSARAAGVEAEIDLEVGGKTDDFHGTPSRVRAVVRTLSDGNYTTEGSWSTGTTFAMGSTAVVDVSGNTLVLTERATPPFHREHLTSIGVNPAEARIIVAKGAVAWRSAYGEDAKTIIEVDAPGACPLDPWVLPRSTTPVTVLPALTPRAGLRKDEQS